MGKKFRMVILLRLDVFYCAQGGGALFLQTPVVRHTHVLHFSRTNPPQEGVEHSRFTWNQTTFRVARLHLFNGLVRGLSAFCSRASVQVHIWILALQRNTPWLQYSLSIVTGALDEMLIELWRCTVERC